MPVALSSVPDGQALERVITSAATRHGISDHRLIGIERTPNAQASTFPSEILTCQFEGGATMRLFCKYMRDDGHGGHGYRPDRDYEAAVYRNVLAATTLPAPFFFGTYPKEPSGVTCVLLEYREASIPASLGAQPETLRLAARWIGEFHAINEERITRPETTFLTRYEADYYVGWARRTAEFARPLHRRFPWLATLCQAFERSVVELLLPSLTIIHGEYYPRNILWHNRGIYPIDWESAAVGAGEIDLACLADGWSSHVTRLCEREYRQARWPSGAPTEFPRRLDAARMYVHLRWLGDWAPQTLEKGFRWRFDELRRVGRRLGVL